MERLNSVLVRCCGTYSRLRAAKLLQRRCLGTTCSLQYKWEPDDLKLEPDIPEYPPINVSMKGYDFPVLESFAKQVHRLALNLQIDCDSWPVPPKKLEVQTLKFNTKLVTDRCNLNVHERVVQLHSLPSTKLPIFLEMMRNSTPQGVEIQLKEMINACNTVDLKPVHATSENPDWIKEDEEYLYVPDFDQLKLKEALEDLEEM